MNAFYKFYAVLWLITTGAFAQNTHTIDSLQKVLKTDINNQAKVNTYNRLAAAYLDTDSAKVAHYTSLVFRLAQDIGYSKGAAKAWFHLGWVNLMKGYTTEAGEHFKESLQISQKARDNDGIGTAYNGIALVYYYQSQWDKSLHYHQQALKIRTQIDDKEGMAASTHNMALIYKRWGKYEKALEFFQQSLRLEIAMANQKGISETYNSIGNIQVERGNYSEALTLYHKALKIALKSQHQDGLITSYANIALVYDEQGSYQKALEFFKRALVIAKKMGNKRKLAILYSNLGRIYRRQGDYPTALKYFYQSLKIEQKSGNQLRVTKATQRISSIYGLQGDYQKALKLYQQVLKDFIQLKYQKGVTEGYSSVGAIYLQLGDYQEAEVYYQKALDVSQKMVLKWGITRSYLGLGKAALQQKQYSKAESFFEKALTIRKTLGQKALSAEAEVNLGIAYFWLKDYLQALKSLKKGIETAAKTGVPANVRDGAEYLAKVYEVMGQPQKALENYILFKQMADSLLNKRNIQKITRLETQYAAQKREDSLKQVQVQKEQAMQADIRQRKTTQQATYMGLVLSGLLIIVLFLFYRVQQRSNHKLGQVNKALEQALQELKALDSFKERLVGMIAHDLKNPLQAIMGLSADQPNHSYLSAIYQAARRMHLLILNMLDTQKYTQTRISLNTSSQSLHQLGSNALEQVQWFAQAKNIKLFQVTTQDVHLLLDGQLISRVLMNLLHNAVKFTPENSGITLKYEVLAATQEIKVQVIDQGVGINPAQQQAIFEPYHQVNAHQGSTGLGLAFCKMVIDAHQGRIGVDSVVGQGSTFWFTLPLANEASLEVLPTNQSSYTQTLDIALGPEDKAFLSPYLSQIKEYEFYHLTKIREILDQIDVAQHPQLALWKEALREAIITSDQQQYEHLIDI
ncbi:MAG TPA: hypothetical protein DCS93_12200 [Microscillaceae bacterium]|nr:hypothetical protein [Microscillaceae bacterium]